MSEDENDSYFNIRGLDDLELALGSEPIGRIGVLGGKSAREGELSNAEIGAIHETGAGNNPVRSWLAMPLTLKFNEYLENAKLFDKAAIAEIIKTKSVLGLTRRVLIVAETIVQDAFDSGGFGEWPPSDMSRKTNHQTLVETQQLRNSVTSEANE